MRAFAPDERLGKIHVTNDAVWIEPWEELDVEAGIEIRSVASCCTSVRIPASHGARSRRVPVATVDRSGTISTRS